MRVANALKLFTVATVASVLSTARAADCTSSELDQLLSAEQQVYASTDCATISVDMSTATTADVCASACMDFLSGVASDFPNCEYYGVNMRATLEELLAQCGISADKDSAAEIATSKVALVSAAAVATLALIAA